MFLSICSTCIAEGFITSLVKIYGSESRPVKFITVSTRHFNRSDLGQFKCQGGRINLCGRKQAGDLCLKLVQFIIPQVRGQEQKRLGQMEAKWQWIGWKPEDVSVIIINSVGFHGLGFLPPPISSRA